MVAMRGKNPNWVLNQALVKLYQQVQSAYPGRSTTIDGTIGDTEHKSRASDHNPSYGRVNALDLTTSTQFDAHAFAEHLRQVKDARIKYVISNRRIFAGNGGIQPWKWRTYTGLNPHIKHIHISVIANAGAEPWKLPTAPVPSTATDMTANQPMVLTPTWLDVGRTVAAFPGKNFMLWAGNSLNNGPAKLILQPDGNVVSYVDKTPVWQTGVRGDALVLQADGALILYRDGKSVWETKPRFSDARAVTMTLDPSGKFTLWAERPYWVS